MNNELYRVFSYTLSHDQLLIRRRNREDGTNTDIVFDGVAYLELPTMLEDVVIAKPTVFDYLHLWRKAKLLRRPQTLTVLKSKGKKYYVSAAHMWKVENSLSMLEVPFDGHFEVSYKGR